MPTAYVRDGCGVAMTSASGQHYRLYLSGNDDVTNVFSLVFAENDEAALARLSGNLRPWIDRFPIGRLCTPNGVPIWRRGPANG